MWLELRLFFILSCYFYQRLDIKASKHHDLKALRHRQTTIDSDRLSGDGQAQIRRH